MSFSTELPDGIVRIRSDAKAKEFLFALGILDELAHDVTLADGGIAPNQSSMFVCFYDHPTHWILGCRFHDCPAEKENGFTVLAWPRNKYPAAVVEDFLSELPLKSKIIRSVQKFGEEKPPLS